MNPKMMEYLVCPYDGTEDLKLHIFNDAQNEAFESKRIEVLDGIIVCENCLRWYPIVDGIPTILPDELRCDEKDQSNKDVSFLKKWEEEVPDTIRLTGKPINLSNVRSRKLVSSSQKTKSLKIGQHEDLSNQAAKEYELHETLNPGTRFIMKKEEELVFKSANSLVQKKVALDLGCGTGRHAIELAKDFEFVIAVDISHEMVYEGRRICNESGILNIDFIIGDAEHLMFQRRTFDLVVAGFGLLSFVFNLSWTANKISDLLRLGGILFTTVYNKRFRAFQKILRILPWQSPLAISWPNSKPETMIVQFGKKFEIHSKPFEADEFRDILRKAGVESVRTSCSPALLPLLPKRLLTNRKVYRKAVFLEKIIARLMTRLSWLPPRGAYILVIGKRVSRICPPHKFSKNVVFSTKELIKEELICNSCGFHQVDEFFCS